MQGEGSSRSPSLWPCCRLRLLVSVHWAVKHKSENSNIHSHELDELSKVYCRAQIPRELPTCEHKPTLACGFDVNTYKCSSICGGKMTCCQNDCKSKCFDCQQLNGARQPGIQNGGDGDEISQVIERTEHIGHRCKRTLNCGHQCSMDCSSGHVQSGCIMPCKEPCRQQCKHSKCKSKCSDPCAPCKERCTWWVFPLLRDELESSLCLQVLSSL